MENNNRERDKILTTLYSSSNFSVLFFSLGNSLLACDLVKCQMVLNVCQHQVRISSGGDYVLDSQVR